MSYSSRVRYKSRRDKNQRNLRNIKWVVIFAIIAIVILLIKNRVAIKDYVATFFY